MAHRTLHHMVYYGHGFMPHNLARIANRTVNLGAPSKSVIPGRINGRRGPYRATRPDIGFKDISHLKNNEARWTLTGGGSKNTTAMQSFAFNENSRRLYSHNTSIVNNIAYSIISRHSMNTLGNQGAADASGDSPYVGHQGLGVELATGRVWSGGPYTPQGSYDSTYAYRFTYAANTNLSGGDFFKIFPSGCENCTPTISYDQKYLVAFANRPGPTNPEDFWTFRVFDLASLIAAGPGDYSSSYLSHFQVQRGSDPYVNGIASDGAYIYVIFGGGALGGYKIMRQYSFDGALCAENRFVTVGFADAGDYWEPEGLAFFKLSSSDVRPVLAFGFSNGVAGGRTRTIYVP